MKRKTIAPVLLKPVLPGWEWNVKLNWSRPEHYEKIDKGGFARDKKGWFYMILGCRDSCDPEIFYIGRVFQTCVSRRLRQPDHRRRHDLLVKKYRNYLLKVSLATVKLKGKGHITFRRIVDIEKILICTACQSHQFMINRQERSSYPKTLSPYIIHNRGSRHPLPKTIFVGIFTTDEY